MHSVKIAYQLRCLLQIYHYRCLLFKRYIVYLYSMLQDVGVYFTTTTVLICRQ